MMFCMASAAWSHHVSSPYYTEHGQRCGAVLSGRITTVAMSRMMGISLYTWSLWGGFFLSILDYF
jgi:hypothetical protein